ncbi:hypothetical protein [Croceibacterium ferulae]|uniref:hypothetical protein n=1 Tax=Croceibacterium ferulae TaxID=1854641 RepID=UPI000EB280CB|nr:hypothetical protein [Croceibacterium ferulae]
MGGWPLWHSYRSEARAVMEAIRDPSTAAVTAAAAKSGEIDRGDFAGIYRTMIDAMLAEGP